MTNMKRPQTLFFLMLAGAGCVPRLETTPPPASVVSAVFDPANSRIPLPNDLVLQQDPTTLGLPPAQVEFLQAFIAQKGFPNDQEVPITVDFMRSVIDSTSGAVTTVAPKLDLGSFTSSTAFLWVVRPDGQGEAPLDPIQASDYADKGTYGELTLHHRGRLPWPSGQYILLIRGGDQGIKTVEKDPVYPSQIFFLLEQEQDLTTEKNLGLLKAQLGSTEKAKAAAIQLNALSTLYKATAFPLADTRFPHEDLAIASTFRIADKYTQVELDPGRGLVPLPIDLLRDQKPGGTLTALAACTLASGKLDDKGTCRDAQGNPSGLAAGFMTLDGFSTTGAILLPMSELVNAATVNPTTVKLYDISNPSTPQLVNPASYITEPCEVTSTCSSTAALSPAIVLQPAGITADDPTTLFRTRPLKDNNDYAVVVTTDVKDKAGHKIVPGTAAKILLFSNPLVDAQGHSLLQGVEDANAAGLDAMRKKLGPVISAIGVERSTIAMAYTFHTQSFTDAAVKLGALPYKEPPMTAMPGAVTATSAIGAFHKYGVDPTFVPSRHVAEVLETTITGFNLLDPASGAFSATGTINNETLNVLIAVPTASAAATCTGPLAPFGAAGIKCAPMVVFRHGLGSGRASMLTVADRFAEAGMVTVAIDAAKHGDRAFCASDGECDVGSCVADPALAHQGDPKGRTPGHCMMGSMPGHFKKRPVDCPAMGGCPFPPSDGIPIASSNFVISANFFRLRDTFRQDIIDQSQLIRAIAFAPMGMPPTGHSVFDHMFAGAHVVIDPTQIYYVGQSLGSVQGAATVASNPRISKAVLNVGGGTAVDLFLNSPAFKAGVDQLLFSVGVEPGTAKYLQFLVVAKTILDPADPINFVGRINDDTLPNLLPPLGGNADGSVAQAQKKLLAQMAYCDQVVPNPFGYIFASNARTGPLPGQASFGMGMGTFQIFVDAPTNLRDCPYFGGPHLPQGAANHGFITEWVVPDSLAKASAVGVTRAGQRDAALFLSRDVVPQSVQGPIP